MNGKILKNSILFTEFPLEALMTLWQIRFVPYYVLTMVGDLTNLNVSKTTVRSFNSPPPSTIILIFVFVLT